MTERTVDDASIDPTIYDLYDEYCHTGMDRREFLRRATLLGVAGGFAGCAMGKAVLPDYPESQTISFTDSRIRANYVTFDSPGGNGSEVRGYLVAPAGAGPFPSVLVVHENRGLNPYIEDVARRVAVEGFLALAPDALWPVGGYPGNDDDGKVLQRKLDPDKIHVDMVNSARFIKDHALSTNKLGVTGFCFGGGVSNFLATELGADLAASAPFYGRAADLAKVPAIRAELVIHYAEDDPRVNAMRPDYENALRGSNVRFTSHSYKGTRHGFHNGSTPRYNPEAARLAWQRTIGLFERALT